jgi:hypothetical protein
MCRQWGGGAQWVAGRGWAGPESWISWCDGRQTFTQQNRLARPGGGSMSLNALTLYAVGRFSGPLGDRESMHQPSKNTPL